MGRPRVQENWTEETHIGPPSEQISIQKFIRQAKDVGLYPSPSALESELCQKWANDVPFDIRKVVEEELDTSSLRSGIESILRDPRQLDTVTRHNEAQLLKLLEEDKPALDRDLRDWANRSKPVKIDASEPMNEGSYITPESLRNIKLKCWPVHDDAHVYVKRLGTEYINSLNEIKRHGLPVDQTGPHSNLSDPDVLVTLTIYSPNTARYVPLRVSSQHVFLGSHTLGDLVDIFPCPSNDIPLEVLDEDGYLAKYDVDAKMDAGCVIAMEEPWLHGDGMNDVDYADRYLRLMAQHPEVSGSLNLLKGSNLYETTFSSTPLRINYPYFILHQGNCQHYMVIDQIRLRHSSDPPPGQFPVTIHHAPATSIRPKCRICLKLQATLSIVGDVRLGETPCLLCSECWELMGEPEGHPEESIFVVALTAGEMV